MGSIDDKYTRDWKWYLCSIIKYLSAHFLLELTIYIVFALFLMLYYDRSFIVTVCQLQYYELTFSFDISLFNSLQKISAIIFHNIYWQLTKTSLFSIFCETSSYNLDTSPSMTASLGPVPVILQRGPQENLTSAGIRTRYLHILDKK